ncbi:GDA1/CD39 NTPase family protein [Pleurotus pulmonarius]
MPPRATRRRQSNSSSATTTTTSSSSSVRPNITSALFRIPSSLAKMAIMSPRSANYERLEGGMGPGRRTGLARFAWKKFAVAAVVLIGLVYFFGPREPKDLMKWHNEKEPAEHNAVAFPDDDEELDTPSPLATIEPPPPPASTHNEHIAIRPTSFETDPDPSKTVHCTSPHDPSAHLVQYALMIDAGSTGSRIHVYKFNNCGPSPSYEYETFKQIQPGLSKYSGKAAEAAQSLDVLMDEAMRVVPEDLRKCTPVAVKATAGLRLLGTTESGAILDAVRDRLHMKYPFVLAEKDGVVVMDGKDEGVYAWITANYLLNTIRADTPTDTPTYAVLDLGGASTQIVFEPKFSQPDSSLVEGEHKYDLTFGGKTHVLYQHSYLGYGLMRARKHVHQLVDFMASLRVASDPSKPVGNPCLAKGTERVVEVDGKGNITMVGEDIGSFEACNRIVELVMAKDAICEVKPCSFNGVYQPSLMDSFPAGKVLLLSYFYDRLHPLLPTDSSSPITVSTLSSLATDVCKGRSVWEARWGNDKEVMDELAGRPEWCLDMTFMHALLRLGYEFGAEREVRIAKQVEGTELGWCLGATIAMVGGTLTCRL